MKGLKKIFYSISIILFVLGLISFLIYPLIGSSVDKNGLLHEPFFLIPIGYLFVFSGLFVGSMTFLIPKILKK